VDDHVGGADDFIAPLLSESRNGSAVERSCVERFVVRNFWTHLDLRREQMLPAPPMSA
jgi:hypothetical protein